MVKVVPVDFSVDNSLSSIPSLSPRTSARLRKVTKFLLFLWDGALFGYNSYEFYLNLSFCITLYNSTLFPSFIYGAVVTAIVALLSLVNGILICGMDSRGLAISHMIVFTFYVISIITDVILVYVFTKFVYFHLIRMLFAIISAMGVVLSFGYHRILIATSFIPLQ